MALPSAGYLVSYASCKGKKGRKKEMEAVLGEGAGIDRDEIVANSWKGKCCHAGAEKKEISHSTNKR